MYAMSGIASADGTSLALWREGSGHPLVLVHGGLCDHLAWHFVIPLFARQYTVWTFDRRGHGRSADTPPHSVEREVEDIHAVVHAIGEPVHLLGHSAGAILCLRAALHSTLLRSLILYEPPFIVDNARPHPGPAILAEMQRLLAAGDPDRALRIAMRETVALSDPEIDRLQQQPGWEHLRAAATAIPNDWKIWEETLIPADFAALRTPALLLRGALSPAWIRAASQAVRNALPNAALEEIDGQGHSAMITAPEIFAGKVMQFLSQVDSGQLI